MSYSPGHTVTADIMQWMFGTNITRGVISTYLPEATCHQIYEDQIVFLKSCRYDQVKGEDIIG